MINLKKLMLTGLLIANTSLFATYENDKDTLGNIALKVGIWKSDLGGSIENENSATDFENDFGYDDSKNINTFALDLKNDISWLPNVNISYFRLNNSSTNIFTSDKTIAGVNNINGKVSSTVEYQEINTILYGFLYNGPFEFDFGLNFKKIDYTQYIIENNGGNPVIYGPDSIIVLPYGAIKINLDFIDTVLMAKASILSFGDNEAKDYEYSINYRVMRNIYLSYGYKYNSFKTTNENNDQEIYDVNIKGNYISCKILF